MTEKVKLLEDAYFVGILNLGLSSFGRTKPLFSELVHYFNINIEEIGYISFPDSSLETVKIFDIPRKWDKSILDKYSIYKTAKEVVK